MRMDIDYDLWSFSIASFSSIIIIVNLKLAVNTKLWNKFHYICMFGFSIVLYFIFILIYDVLTYTSSFHTVYMLLGTHYYYFCIFANVSLVCIVDLGLTFAHKLLYPTNSDILAYGCSQLSSENTVLDVNDLNNNLSEKGTQKIELPEVNDEHNIKIAKGERFTYENKVIDLSSYQNNK